MVHDRTFPFKTQGLQSFKNGGGPFRLRAVEIQIIDPEVPETVGMSGFEVTPNGSDEGA